MTRVAVTLEPLDTLFFRDGRPLSTGSRIKTGMLFPQTLAGALRTWLLYQTGCDLKKLGNAMRDGADFATAANDGQPEQVAQVAQLTFRGPWFACVDQNEEVTPFVPAPATLQRIEGEEKHEFVRLDPLVQEELPGWKPPVDGMVPLWRRGRRPQKPLRGYLNMNGLREFLQGGIPESIHFQQSNDLFDSEPRTGIEIVPRSLSAQEGMIYTTEMLSLKRGVRFYAEIEIPDFSFAAWLGEVSAGPVTIPLGGQGRQVILRRNQPISWPEVEDVNGQPRLLLLTSPGIFSEGWLPRGISPIAAAVPGHVAVSGWDLARRGPKPNRFAVQAGSVYFLQEPLAPKPASLCEGEDATLGWGTYLEGVWNDV